MRANWLACGTTMHTPHVAILLGISALMVGVLMLPLAAALAVIQTGEEAPGFTLQDSAGQSHTLDDTTSDTVLLVIVKPGDHYTTATLGALDHLFENHPPLESGLRRWVIVSRIDSHSQVKQVETSVETQWPVLIDTDDQVYHAYHIIATPTIVVVGSNRRILAVNPGYDRSMEERVLKTLSEALPGASPDGATSEPLKVNMTLQMGRRLAARGLWDRALVYYTRAMKEEPLPVSAQLELAEIYIELERPDEALSVLNQIPADSPQAVRLEPLVQRARTLKERPSKTLKPPKLIR